jgi:hypothetical protein
METVWRVELNTGSPAFFICIGLRKEVRRPQCMTRYGFFSLLAPRALISEKILQNLSKLWL